MRLTDRRTDGQTDSFIVARPRCNAVQKQNDRAYFVYFEIISTFYATKLFS